VSFSETAGERSETMIVRTTRADGGLSGISCVGRDERLGSVFSSP
jgi:hypothetical protein